MSKFYLPTQKGSELFPTTVVAPPIMRWVGVDARTAEAQAIIDTFGSAITAFHMQQAHNHSLSLNTQSRGFLQIAPNIGVEYVNQGGMEYITIHVQPSKSTEEPEVKSEKPAQPVVCWFPEAGVHGMLSDAYPDIELIDLPLSVVYETDAYVFFSCTGTFPLNFNTPLVIKGQSYSEIGVDDAGTITFGGTAFPTSVVDLNPGGITPDLVYQFGPPRFTVWSGIGSRTKPPFSPEYDATVRMGSGGAQFGSTPRNCVLIEWRNTATYSYAVPDPGSETGSRDATATETRTYQLIIVEALVRDGRPACPALIGFCGQFVQVSDYEPDNGSYGLWSDPYPRYEPEGTSSTDLTVSGSAALCSAGTTRPLDIFATPGSIVTMYDDWDLANGPTIIWVALDPNTGALSSLRPAEEWVNF